MTEFIGFNPPFIGGSQKILSRQDDERLIRNDVLNNLLILPNELPFRPTYGVNLRNFVFEKMDSSAIDQLKHEIISQIKQATGSTATKTIWYNTAKIKPNMLTLLI